MKQKEVKIIGLSLDKPIGIIKACKLSFDENNRIIAIKGEVGAGKSSLQKAIRLNTEGAKVLNDKGLYGDIETEVQLLDGDTKVWIGAKSQDNKLAYVLYTKDENGKILKNPIIDGVKATPAAYLENLQTELTWHLDEITSESQVIQRDILLKLYQNELKSVGVVFDKKSPKYAGSILDKITKAEQERDIADAIRKQKGGIKEDLSLRGFDPDRPETIPDYVDISAIENKIRDLEKEITILETRAESGKQSQLDALKNKGIELKNKCVEHNHKLQLQYENEVREREIYIQAYKDEQSHKAVIITRANVAEKELKECGYIGEEVNAFIRTLPLPETDLPEMNVKTPNYILIEGDKVTDTDTQKPYIAEIIGVKSDYMAVYNSSTAKADTSKQQKEIEILQQKLKDAAEINLIVSAVDSFHEWRHKNDTVLSLKAEYVRMLAKIETGVKGLKIAVDGDMIFLTYNGEYDPAYFGNPEKEDRKLSAYSDTQKPMICLLLQNYLLSKKPKALRYLFIDRIPIDKKTRVLLENMCEELNLHLFVNITGDFDRAELKEGEILVEGGEVFFA